jgi:hypothetical protein
MLSEVYKVRGRAAAALLQTHLVTLTGALTLSDALPEALSEALLEALSEDLLG